MLTCLNVLNQSSSLYNTYMLSILWTMTCNKTSRHGSCRDAQNNWFNHCYKLTFTEKRSHIWWKIVSGEIRENTEIIVNYQKVKKKHNIWMVSSKSISGRQLKINIAIIYKPPGLKANQTNTHPKKLGSRPCHCW